MLHQSNQLHPLLHRFPLLYLWAAQNSCMASAQRSCAGFREFSKKIFMHRARAARPRGFDSLPSLSDVGTLSFRWILPFWYFCFLLAYKASLALYAKRKQKHQNGNIHRKLKVPMSVILSLPKVQYKYSQRNGVARENSDYTGSYAYIAIDTSRYLSTFKCLEHARN